MDERLAHALSTLSGLATRAELLVAGAHPESFAPAWADGEIIRVRHGLYAVPGLPDDVMRAARVGGVLASLSAIPLLGLWQPPNSVLHVSVRANSKGLRDPDYPTVPLDRQRPDLQLLHDGHRLGRRERLHVNVANCLRQVLRQVTPRLGLAVLDSALRRFGPRAVPLDWLREQLPARCAPVLVAGDPRAEAGSESVMRWELIRLRIPFEPQKELAGGIRVDFLVAGRLVVECVSYQFHSSPADYAKDRKRIAAIARQGYRVLEFTSNQVLHEWEMVEATIAASLAQVA